jgi:hypothetical protein
MKMAKLELLCSTIILCLVLGLAGCSKTPTDSSIGDAIKSGLYTDPQLKNDRVEVSVSNGEVTLSGELSSVAAKAEVLKLASGTFGVRKVNDLMQVQALVPAKQPEPVASQTASATSSPRRRPKKIVPSQYSSPSETNTEPSSPQPVAVQEPELPPRPPEQPTISQAPPQLPPPPRKMTVPAGTSIRIRMIDSVDSAVDRVGQRFHTSLEAPIVVGNEVIVPKGADVVVKLTEASQAGRIQGQSQLQLALDHLQFQGKSYPLSSTTYEQRGESRGKDTVKKVGVGTAIGAAIGAIAGGGKGAAIGAGAGAGAGTAMQVFIKGKQVKIPSETKLDFELEQPVEFTLPPSSNRDSQNGSQQADSHQ